ncbi:MAG: hypothetical protein KGH60_02555 [Candidatus Micrarchaeota archaeon]|nr:hypothetical protein [Candidatus Micrarchaeota archaeon]
MGDDRVKTGITGLDAMLGGGIPSTDQIIIAGGPGAGKTLISFEILYHNAKAGIPTAFIALEEQPNTVVKNAKQAFPEFTDIDDLINSKLLFVDGEDPASKITPSSDSQTYSFGNVVSEIEGIIKVNNAKVVVIDSISLLKLMLPDKLIYRKSMIALVSNLRRLGVTTILTSEISSYERSRLKFNEEFFIFDGLVTMYQTGEEDKRVFALEIVKLRGSAHSKALSPYDITSQGFRIFTLEQ